MPETEQRNINLAALPDFHTSSGDNILFCPLPSVSVRSRGFPQMGGWYLLKYNGGDSGIKISVLYWRVCWMKPVFWLYCAVSVCVCVCVSLCVYVCMCVCMYVCMYAESMIYRASECRKVLNGGVTVWPYFCRLWQFRESCLFGCISASVKSVQLHCFCRAYCLSKVL
jgi:hypothetical protein